PYYSPPAVYGDDEAAFEEKPAQGAEEARIGKLSFSPWLLSRGSPVMACPRPTSSSTVRAKLRLRLLKNKPELSSQLGYRGRAFPPPPSTQNRFEDDSGLKVKVIGCFGGIIIPLWSSTLQLEYLRLFGG
ncbi:MAG: hypothetical protein QXI02_06525, partial [Candidatus Caldarchaeum sp.]